MHIIRSSRRALLIVAVLALAAPARVAAQQPSTDPLVGTWILNVARSKLVGAAPKSRYRTIDATHDGMIHVSYGTVDDKGTTSFGFWEAKLDGTEAVEYMRSTGAAPYAQLYVKRVDPRTVFVKAMRNGKVSSEVSFSASADGKTLTEDMTSYTDQGMVRNIRVYDKQP